MNCLLGSCSSWKNIIIMLIKSVLGYTLALLKNILRSRLNRRTNDVNLG